MKNSVLLVYSFFISCMGLFAQDLEDSLLWKVSGNGLAVDSYLFGTLHATCETELQPRVAKAFDKTEQLALEIDLSDMGIEMAMANKMYLENGKSLPDFLNETETQAIKSLLEEHIPSMSFEMLKRIKPIFISTLLVQALVDCDASNAYDMMLLKKAQAYQKPISGLETIEDQLAVFDAISLEEQLQELLDMAEDNLKSDKTEFKKMLELYESESIEGLAEVMQENESVFTDYMAELLDHRNEKWIAKIEEMMQEKSSFIGFGVMHLVGEKGVINLLRKQGYQVEAVLE